MDVLKPARPDYRVRALSLYGFEMRVVEEAFILCGGKVHPTEDFKPSAVPENRVD